MALFDFENMYCGLIRRGDIFIFEKQKGQEVPVVVLQDTVLNDGLSSVICAAIEPKKTEIVHINEVLLEKSETGLGKESICLLHQISSLPRHKFISKKGEVRAETLQKMYAALDITLGRFRDR